VIFELRLLVVVLAAFTAGSALATALVPAAVTRALEAPVRDRADALFRARMMPGFVGAAVALLALAAHLLFERRSDEPVGLFLPALAGVTVVLALTGGVRVWRTVMATRAALGGWMRTAEPVAIPGLQIPAFAVDSEFPIVAAVGVMRPRLVIARSVLQGCSEEELGAILAHERHHVEHRDNLRRVLMLALPDPLSVVRRSRRLLTAWRDAGEDAADEAAARLGPHGRGLLAQALVRVARLAPPAATVGSMPASALYRGGSLERRVRRLLEPSVAPSRRPGMPMTALIVMAAVSAFAQLDAVHQVIEHAVTHLP